MSDAKYRIKEFAGEFTIQVKQTVDAISKLELWFDCDKKGNPAADSDQCYYYSCFEKAVRKAKLFKKGPVYHELDIEPEKGVYPITEFDDIHCISFDKEFNKWRMTYKFHTQNDFFNTDELIEYLKNPPLDTP